MRHSMWLMTGLLAAGMGMSFCSCRTASSSALAGDLAGVYSLATINGNPLPCTPPHRGGAPEVRSGSITLNADGTFTSKMGYGLAEGKAASRDFKGSYIRDGSTFTLKWSGAGKTSATLVDDKFNMMNEGVLFTYQKEFGSGEAGPR